MSSTTCATCFKLVDYDLCDSIEVARTMLAISGKQACCEYERVPLDCKQLLLTNKLPELKEYPLGLPVLVVDGKTKIYHANAINIYLAQKLGFGGKDACELAQCAAVNAAVLETCEGFCPKIKDCAARMAAMKEYTECGYVEWLHKLNTFVAAQSAATGYIVGDQLTYADLVVADLLETAEMHAPGSIVRYQTEFAALHAAWAKTNADERVKAYKEKRGAKVMPEECAKAYKEVCETCACCASGESEKADCGCCDEATGKTMACCADKAAKAGSCCATTSASAPAETAEAGQACRDKCGSGQKGADDKGKGKDDTDCGCCGGAAAPKSDCGCGTTCPCK